MKNIYWLYLQLAVDMDKLWNIWTVQFGFDFLWLLCLCLDRCIMHNYNIKCYKERIGIRTQTQSMISLYDIFMGSSQGKYKYLKGIWVPESLEIIIVLSWTKFWGAELVKTCASSWFLWRVYLFKLLLFDYKCCCHILHSLFQNWLRLNF